MARLFVGSLERVRHVARAVPTPWATIIRRIEPSFLFIGRKASPRKAQAQCFR